VRRLDELDFDLFAEGVGELDERAQGQASIARAFQAGNRLLGGAEPLGQIPLRKALSLPKVIERCAPFARLGLPPCGIWFQHLI